MVKRLVVMMMVSLLLAGCGESQFGTTILTGQDTDLTTRVFVEQDGVAAGVVAKWTPASEIEWGPEPDEIGAFIILEATWDIQATDTPDAAPAPISWLENLHVVPYVGMELVDDIDNGNFSNLQPNWIAGLKYTVSDDGNIAIVTEYVDGDQASGDVFVGLRYVF